MTASSSSSLSALPSTSDYMVGCLIDEGSFGRVVYGKHKSTGKHVAIKVYDKYSIQKRPELGQSIWNERTLLKQWNDQTDTIVSLWSAFHDKECIYLVMECCTGGTLSHVISCGFNDERRWYKSIPQYGLQIVEALEFLHSKHYIHADMKPDNILLSSSSSTTPGRLKLTDFGSCIMLNDNNTQSSSTPFIMTTSAYAPPELLSGGTTTTISQLTVGVDLWSFGCVLATMFLGISPFDAPSEALTIQAIIKHASSATVDATRYQLSTITTKNSINIPVSFQALIHDLLHPNPSSRCQAVMYDNTSTSECYSQWKKQSIWKRSDDVETILFQPPPPRWWKETTTTTTTTTLGAGAAVVVREDSSNNDEGGAAEMQQQQQQQLQDGAKGWTAFLL